MAKKILTTALALGLALAAAAFAAGQKEPAAAAAGSAAPSTSAQKLVLTGSLSFQNLVHPTLKVGDKLYELMVPRYLVYQAGLKEGAQATVEGYEVQGMPMWDQGDDNNIDLFVTKATIDGKDYDLSQVRGPMMGGWWSGAVDGRDAPGRGWGRGPGMMGGGMGYGLWNSRGPR